jgi:hypothetical protein
VWNAADKIKKDLEENPKVSKVCYVKLRPGFDHTLIAEFELENKRRLVLSVHQSFDVTYIIEIDKYWGEGNSVMKRGQEWRRGGFTGIPPGILEIKLGKPLRTVDEIIDSYDEILAFVERVYHEPSIPGQATFEKWGDESELKEYAGYTVVSDKWKSKLYIYLDEDQE